MGKSKRVMWIAACVLIGAFFVLKAISFSGSAPVRPEKIQQLPGCPSSPNCVCSQNSGSEHAIAPIRYSGDPEEAWNQLVGLIGQHGGKQVDQRKNGYARFEFRSRLVRFVDDVEILLHPAADQIEIRSASRSGYSDLGVNRRRVEAIRTAFNNRS